MKTEIFEILKNVDFFFEIFEIEIFVMLKFYQILWKLKFFENFEILGQLYIKFFSFQLLRTDPSKLSNIVSIYVKIET